MSYPSQLAVFLERLSGYSTNHFKLMPQGSQSASANNIVRITLPANALVDIKSFALHFDAAITGSGGEGRLPNKIDSLIERVEVAAGGVQMSAGNNFYNVLRHAKDSLMGDHTDPVLAHPDVVRAVSSHKASGVASNKEVAASYVVNHWEGFLGSVEPRMLDLSLLPEVVVSIYLADNAVCVDAAGPGLPGSASAINGNAGSPAPVYALTNIYATLEVIGMADGLYDSMISAAMSSAGGLELPYKQYIAFQDTTQTMRFSVATQSLDRIWIVNRDSNFATPGGAKLVKGHKSAGAFADPTAGAGSTNVDLGKPEFEQGEFNGEKYVSKYFNFPEPHADNKYQLQLNGALYPQWQASYEDWYCISKQSVLGKPQMKYPLLTMKENFSVFCARLNLKDSEFTRMISGLDTRGISLNSFFNSYGTAGGKPTTIFCECSSTLRIGSGLQLEVVQ